MLIVGLVIAGQTGSWKCSMRTDTAKDARKVEILGKMRKREETKGCEMKEFVVGNVFAS